MIGGGEVVLVGGGGMPNRGNPDMMHQLHLHGTVEFIMKSELEQYMNWSESLDVGGSLAVTWWQSFSSEDCIKF